MGRKSGKTSHIMCRRCGSRSYHTQKKRCAKCGYGDASRQRRYAWQTKTLAGKKK